MSNTLFAGVPVADYGSASAWYERLLGRPADALVKQDEAMWQLADGAWVYVVEDPARAGRALLTVLVDDLDELLEALAQRGVDAGAIEERPGAYRRTVLIDPDGNRISFGEALGAPPEDGAAGG